MFCSFAGPDAVKYVVNHSGIQAIFCVPQTLNTVSFIFALVKLPIYVLHLISI